MKTMTARKPKLTRKPTQAKLVAFDSFIATVVINSEAYEIERYLSTPECPFMYRFTKIHDATNESFVCRDADGETTCTCGDWSFREESLLSAGRRCKHQEAAEILSFFEE